MLKISDAVREIIDTNSIFQFGLAHRLFNLSELARFIAPLIANRTQKQVKASAIVMSLSRLQKEIELVAPQPKQFQIENIIVHANLQVMTFNKNSEIRQQIADFYRLIQQQNGFATFTEGISEITIIFDTKFLPECRQYTKSQPKIIIDRVSSVGIKFDNKYTTIPGLLYAVIQQITLQHINLIEVSSTQTEFMMYVDQSQAQLAFDTLFSRFMRQN